jgi:hypothetical protein
MIEYAIGVIAGEGCFTFGYKRKDGNIYPNPIFVVKLKDNDVETLKVLKREFNDVGKISYESGRDMAAWRVHGKEDMKNVVNKIYENGPDGWWESEKAKNFEIWADIIEIYCDGYTDSEQAIEIFDLAKELNADNGREKNYKGIIKEIEENSYGHICGAEKSSSDGKCQRRVPTESETCWDH